MYLLWIDDLEDGKNMIKETDVQVPYAMSVHGEKEIAACLKVLGSSTQMGPEVDGFEKRIAGSFGKKFGIFVNSGSSALLVALESMGFPPGSKVITPALTFGTTVSSILKAGLTPVFVDVCRDSLNIDSNKVAEEITSDTVAMCIPNLMGNLPDWDHLSSIATKYELKVVEDSADIVGVTYKEKRIGYYSDVTTSSFYGNHVINCAGNGGIVCTDEATLADRIRLLRSWGRLSTNFGDSESIDVRLGQELDGIKYDAKFVFEEVGYNLEGSEIGAAFGNVQFTRMSEFLEKRRRICEDHGKFFEKHARFFDLFTLNPESDTVWFAFPILVRSDAPFSRSDLQRFLENHQIQTRPIFTGNIRRQPAFRDIDCVDSVDGYPVADEIMEYGVVLAAHPGLTDVMLSHLYGTIERFLSRY